MKQQERELRLIFEKERVRNLFYYRIDWPEDNPLLIATLDTFDSGNYSRARRILSDFIMANTPPNHKIYFGVASERKHNHDEMKEILQSNGDSYEIVKRTPRSMSRLSKLTLSRRRDANTRILAASTRTNAVVDSLFKTYYYEWYMESITPFIVSQEAPPSWEEQLANLLGPRGQALLRRDTIEASQCTMTTKWEHGIILLSNKMTRPDLDETVRRVAEENSMKLSIELQENSP